MKKSVCLALVFCLMFLQNAFSATEAQDVATSPTGVESYKSLLGNEMQNIAILPAQTDAALKELTGRIASVYNYSAGRMVSVIDQDRNVTLFDNGKVRAQIAYNGGDWSFSSFNVYGTDVAAIRQYNGLKNFLLAVGVKENQLQAYSTTLDDSGYKIVDHNKLVNVAWLDAAQDFLLYGEKIEDETVITDSPGMHRSLMIDFSASYGASLNALVDGQKQETIAYDGTTIGMFSYQNGFLKESTEYTYTLDNNLSKSQGAGVEVLTPSKKISHMDERGRVSYITQAQIVVNENGETIEQEAQIIMQYSYHPSGEVQWMKDLSNETTTYFKAGKQDYKTNKDGYITEYYIYDENGQLLYISGYNNGAQNTLSIFQYGKVVATTSDFSIPYADIVKAVEDLRNPAKTTSEEAILDIITRYGLTSLTLYSTDLNNYVLLKTIFGENYENDANIMEALRIAKERAGAGNPVMEVSLKLTENTSRTLIKRTITEGAMESDGETPINNSNRAKSQDVENGILVYDKDGNLVPYTTTENGTTTYAKKYIYVAKKDGNGNIIMSEDGQVLTELKEFEVGMDIYTQSGELIETDAKTYPFFMDESKMYTDQSNLGLQGYHIYELYDAKKVTSYAFSATVYDSGGQAMTVNGKSGNIPTKTKVETEEQRYNLWTDPAVIGQAQCFTDAQGNEIDITTAQEMIAAGQEIYIKMSPKSINMFDGSGFKDVLDPKEGEEIFVKVDGTEMFDALKNIVGKGEDMLVAGVVTNSIEGKMTMEVYNLNTNAANMGFNLSSTGNKGYAAGDILNKMKNEIDLLASIESSWVSRTTALNKFLFSQTGVSDINGYLKDWKLGWKILLDLL
ncbi:MAG: hypothetical protein LBU55_02665 [Elusimicrobiota bacterium]|jgi:hypothetical protein|nr:hypothetical protein [Elusimicrobiota bacterium]